MSFKFLRIIKRYLTEFCIIFTLNYKDNNVKFGTNLR